MSRKDNKGRKLKDGESQRPNGTYCYRYTDKFKKRRAIYAKDLKTLREKEEQVIKGEISFGSSSIKEMSLADYLEMFVKDQHLRKAQTENIYFTHINRIRKYPIGSVKLKDLTKPMCKEHIAELAGSYADTTVRSVFTFIKHALAVAYEEGIIQENPCNFSIKKMLAGRVVRPPVVLSDKEFDSLIGEMKKSKWYGFYVPHFIFLRETGLRISEFCVLTEDDINFESRMLRINKQIIVRIGDGPNYLDTPKTESSVAYIPLTDQAMEAVKQIMSYTSLRKSISTENGDKTVDGIFVLSKNNKLFNNLLWEQTFRRIAKFYNKKHPEHPLIVRPHSLRHTTATRLLGKGMSVPATQKMMRHASPDMTLKIYTHFTERDLQAELDSIFGTKGLNQNLNQIGETIREAL